MLHAFVCKIILTDSFVPQKQNPAYKREQTLIFKQKKGTLEALFPFAQECLDYVNMNGTIIKRVWIRNNLDVECSFV